MALIKNTLYIRITAVSYYNRIQFDFLKHCSINFEDLNTAYGTLIVCNEKIIDAIINNFKN